MKSNLIPLAAASYLFATLGGSTARAAQPLVTDDAAVLDPYTCQLEAWTRSFRGGSEYWALPACNPSGNLELTAGGARVRANDAGWSSLLQLQGKTVLLPRGDGARSAGVLGGAVRDTGAAHGGSAFQGYYVKALASLYPSDELEIDLNLGAANVYGIGTYALASAAILCAPIERLQLFVEAFHVDPGAPRYQAGARYAIAPNRFEAYLSYGNRTGSGPSEWWAIAGIRWQTEAMLR